MMQVLFRFRDHAHRGLDGDREARDGSTPQRKPAAQRRTVSQRISWSREECAQRKGRNPLADRCGQSPEPKALLARSASEEAGWDVVAIEGSAGDRPRRGPDGSRAHRAIGRRDRQPARLHYRDPARQPHRFAAPSGGASWEKRPLAAGALAVSARRSTPHRLRWSVRPSSAGHSCLDRRSGRRARPWQFRR